MRRIIVTGSSNGIGFEIASRLATEGNALGICARGTDQLKAATAELVKLTRARIFSQQVDLGKRDTLERFIHACADNLGGLDGLVVNAGGLFGGDLEHSTPEDWESTYRMNVGHAERAIRAAVPHLRIAGGGSIVVISSISGSKPAPRAQYGAAKAAQIYLTASLAREFGSQGIRVNAVSPGSTRVPGRRWDRMSHEDPDAFNQFMTEFPAGALVEMDEIADVVAFLLSDAARGVSGANIPVDKGQNAPTAFGY